MRKMGREAIRIFWATAVIALAASVLWVIAPNAPKRALGEYFRPTTVKMMPLPKWCVQTDEAPPTNLMHIVEYQRSFYGLQLQKIVVCRTKERIPAGPAFDEDIRHRWLPMYVGCCSYQFRRHVAVVLANVDDSGSVIVEAALIQNRWAYLRSNWNKDRSEWY